MGSSLFLNATNATVFYLPGTTGWGSTVGGRPTALWWLPYPVILRLPPAFGVLSNGFGFIISWATNADVIVESTTKLVQPNWATTATTTLFTGVDPLIDGWSYFSDPDWTNNPVRFYRIRTR